MRVLAFFAHPDDETLMAGGTLALLARGGHEVFVLSATRGEGGERGDPPLCAQAELGAVRSRELACAVQALGARGPFFLGYRDPLVGPQGELFPFAADDGPVARRLTAWLRTARPHLLLTHGSAGEYGHPAHVQVYRVARRALAALPPTLRPAWYTALARMPDLPLEGLFNPEPAHWLVPLGEPGLAAKVRAAECHRTQHGMFRRAGAARLGRPVSVAEFIAAVPAETWRRADGASETDDGPLGQALPQARWLGPGDEQQR